MDDRQLHDSCGVFGCVATGEWPGKLDVRHMIYLGLIGLQHRGQESAGIVMSEGPKKQFTFHKGMGLVATVFKEDTMAKLRGSVGIGHTRYSTAGQSEILNCQPFIVHTVHGLIATAHNGELVNATSLRQKVMRHGVGLSTGCDSEIITQLLTFTPPEGEDVGPNWQSRIQRFINESPTAYSLLILYGDKIFALRDPYGNRPLAIGKIPYKHPDNDKSHVEPEAWVVSSESCSFYSMGATFHREVGPGEVVEMSKDGIRTLCTIPRPDDKPPAFCVFEYVYFARPDTYLEDQMVYNVRQRCGKRLALEAPVEVDLVSTVPESATPAAMGYSQQTGIPYVEVLTRNRYVGRTFIQPNSRLREMGVAKKFGPLTENLRNKRIVLIDDSIVRGTTMGPIVRLLKFAGAKEVHIRVASPPIHYPCYMGINIPTREELIANKMEISQLAEHFGADSVVYLTIDGLIEAVKEGIPNPNGRQIGHCTACLSGNYPVQLEW